MNHHRRLTILRLAFWGAALFAFGMAIIPQPPELPGEPSDKLQHVSAFLVLGALAFFAYPSTRRTSLGIGLSLFGALIEVVQAIPSLHRDSDPLDWIADTAAATVILIGLRWVGQRRKRASIEEH
jgi:VanZ family protein